MKYFVCFFFLLVYHNEEISSMYEGAEYTTRLRSGHCDVTHHRYESGAQFAPCMSIISLYKYLARHIYIFI